MNGGYLEPGDVPTYPLTPNHPDTVDHVADLVDGGTAVPSAEQLADPSTTKWGVPVARAWKDLAARAVHNGLQAAGPNLLLLVPVVGSVAVSWSWHAWAVVAVLFGTGAATSAAKSLLAWRLPALLSTRWDGGVPPLDWWANAGIAVLMAFLGSLAGQVVADDVFSLLTFSWGHAAQLAAGSAAIAVGKQLVWPMVQQAIALYSSDARVLRSRAAAVEYDARHDA